MKIGIVLGGGGAKGSFQAGVLKRISEDKDLEICAVTGTSVGALNGALTALGKFDKILEIWNSISESKTFYPNYTLGKTYGIFSKSSIYSNQWLKDNISKNISKEEILNCKTFFGCVSSDLKTGKEIFADNNNFPFKENIQNYILASASLPPAFPTIEIDNYSLVDGGLTSPIPVKEILSFNTELDKIIIIPAGTTDLEENNKKGFLENNFRVIDVLYNSIFQDSLEKGIAKYWQSNKKFALIKAEKNLCSTLDCNSKNIKSFIAHGYEVADKNLKDF